MFTSTNNRTPCISDVNIEVNNNNTRLVHVTCFENFNICCTNGFFVKSVFVPCKIAVLIRYILYKSITNEENIDMSIIPLKSYSIVVFGYVK